MSRPTQDDVFCIVREAVKAGVNCGQALINDPANRRKYLADSFNAELGACEEIFRLFHKASDMPKVGGGRIIPNQFATQDYAGAILNPDGSTTMVPLTPLADMRFPKDWRIICRSSEKGGDYEVQQKVWGLFWANRGFGRNTAIAEYEMNRLIAQSKEKQCAT